MRTTLDIADDVLLAVKERAAREGHSVGEMLSDLARASLLEPRRSTSVTEEPVSYGLEPLPHRGPAVSNGLIDRLREEESE